MKISKLLLTIAAFTIFVVSCAKTESTANTAENRPSKTSNAAEESNSNKVTEIAASGEVLYADSCTKCHKVDGTGGVVDIDGKKLKVKNLISKNAKKDSDEEFIEHISEGFPEDGMPPFKDKLSADEIKLVVKYIREELQKS